MDLVFSSNELGQNSFESIMASFCVLRIEDYRLVYLGQDEEAARAASTAGTHRVSGRIMGDALVRAAIEVGHIKHGRRAAHNSDSAVDAPGEMTLSDLLLGTLTGRTENLVPEEPVR